MKKTIILITTLFITFNISFADVGLFRYKNCWWGNVRFTTWANFSCTMPATSMNRSCRLCNTMCFSESKSTTWPMFGAHCVSWLGHGGPGHKFGEKKGQQCTLGKKNNYKLHHGNTKQAMLPPPPPTYDHLYARDTFSDIVFDSIARTITIKDYFAVLRLNHDDLSSVFINLSIKGIYNNLQDTFVDNDSIFKTINVYLQGNAIAYTGIDEEQFTEIDNSATVFEYHFVGGDIVITVPENINFEFVGVLMDTDMGDVGDGGGGGGEPFIAGITENQDTKYEIRNIFPSPTHDYLNLNIYSKESALNTIKIVDLIGREVYAEKNINLSKGNNFKQIEASFLKPGNYILIIGDGRRKYQFKFSKE